MEIEERSMTNTVKIPGNGSGTPITLSTDDFLTYGVTGLNAEELMTFIRLDLDGVYG